MRDGCIDVAVHSAKDLPSVLEPDFVVAAFLPRADARDVLVSSGGPLRNLPAGARVGTSSPRRMCQVRALRPDLEVVAVRGNVDTRLRKVKDGQLEAVMLAAAGIIRLGREAEITEWLDASAVIPCVGQGALAAETRASDTAALSVLGVLDDAPTRAAVQAERAFLAELGAGCLAAVAAHARIDGDVLRVIGMIGSPDGRRHTGSVEGAPADAQSLGAHLARRLLGQGAASWLTVTESRLRGMRIAVTRAAQQSALVALLRARGADVVACPTIAIEPLADASDLDDALCRLSSIDWVAFTSMNAVSAVADRLDALRIGLPERVRLAAVGPGTAASITARLRPPHFVSATASGDALGASMPDVSGRAVLFPCGDLAHDALAGRLTERGATVHRVVAYRTVPAPGVGALRDRLNDGTLDAVIFASPSSVRPVADAIAAARARGGHPLIVCIGSTTAGEARALGLEPDVIAPSPSTGAVVEALERHLR